MSYLSSFFFFLFKQKTAYEMRISDWSSDVCSSDLGNQYPLSGNRFNPPSPCVPLSCESHHLIDQNILRDLTLEVINHNGWPILLDHVDRDSRFIINHLFPECRIKTKKASFCFVLQRSRSIINSIGPETILGESRHVHHLTEPCFCESHFKVFLVILNEFLQRPPLRPKWDNIT